jgi:hypothetical protein
MSRLSRRVINGPVVPWRQPFRYDNDVSRDVESVISRRNQPLTDLVCSQIEMQLGHRTREDAWQ